MNQKFALVLISSAAFLLQGGGRDGGSALRYNERNLLPPQMVDLSQFDNVIDLECCELKNYINFSGTRLNAVVKVKVDCHKDTRGNRYAQPLRYEDLWYQRGFQLGSKKYGPIPISERDNVAIFVTSKLGFMSEAEVAACASALVLLRLELALNRNLIVTVRVPNQSLEGLVSELRKQNFVRYPEIYEQLDSLIPIQLETDLGRKETLCFRSIRQIPVEESY